MLKTLLPYPIPRRQHRCHACLKPFQRGTFYYTLLHMPPSKLAGQRSDFCSSCGSEQCAAREKFTIFWQGKLPEQEQGAAFPHQEAVLLLRELASGDAEQAFLLSLYLVRRRQLAKRHEETSSDGEVWLWYEVLATGELLAVPKVIPQPAAAVELERLLKERLAG